MSVTREGAISFCCDARGEIHRILRDDFGLPERVRVSKPVMAAVADTHLMDFMKALRQLQERGEFDGPRFGVPLEDGDEVVLQFAGRRADEDGLFVIAGATGGDLLEAVIAAPTALEAVEEAEAAVDDLLALSRALQEHRDEVRRLRGETAARLDAAARDLQRLARAVSDRDAGWTDGVRGEVAEALEACARLLRDLADD